MSSVDFRHVHFRIGRPHHPHRPDVFSGDGETLVLLGRSGSGKTTALRLINGMMLPSSGEVRVEARAPSSGISFAFGAATAT